MKFLKKNLKTPSGWGHEQNFFAMESRQESPRKRRAGRDGRTHEDVFEMANKWKDSEVKILSEVITEYNDIDNARSMLIDRFIMLEKAEADNPTTFGKSTHFFGRITNFVTPETPNEKHFITCKFYNHMGEVDGRPSDEDASQLWLMPEIGTTYEEDGVEYTLVEYALSIVSCEFKVKEKTSTAAAASACTSPGIFCFFFVSYLIFLCLQTKRHRTRPKNQRHQNNKVAVKVTARKQKEKKGKTERQMLKVPNVV